MQNNDSEMPNIDETYTLVVNKKNHYIEILG